MLQLLRTHFPSTTQYSPPRHGMFIWLKLSDDIDTGELLKVAIEKEQIAFLPGHAFGIGQDRNAAHCMRLNFSHCSVAAIEDGIKR
ncbi:MAG: hypothetical protein E6J34_15845 [Chloroflexi bacterium]|nr:MAG: hypothetical protein E6J34_15845 [Chloroflexota bacterium]